METVVDQWKAEENEVEEVGLQRKRGLQPSIISSDTDVQGGGQELDQSIVKQDIIDMIRTEVNREMILQSEDSIEESTILPASDPPIPNDPIYLNTVTPEIGKVAIMIENGERQEVYLERVFQKPPTHGFYCPNCKSCIQKVYIQEGELEQITIAPPPPPPLEPIRCSSCFSFLIPIGSWLFPGLVNNDDDGALNQQETDSLNNNIIHDQILKGAPLQKDPEPDQSMKVNQSAVEDTSKPAVNTAEDLGAQVANEVEDKINDTGIGFVTGDYVMKLGDPKGPVAPRKKHFWGDWAIIGGASDAPTPKQPETSSSENSDWRVIMPHDNKQPEIKDDEGYTGQGELAATDESTPLLTSGDPVMVQEVTSSKALEILKSIVYGGLTESLASLSVVTSAASADATTLNIVALAMANLIGGLFVFVHNLGELKAEQPNRAENQTEATVDRYNELLGQRKNFFLHAFIAIISFIVFGLVPPVVYGFSFHENDDKDLKLAALAGASLLCITLLSIAKAYIQRPNSFVVYFQTVLYYVSTGAVASVLSYLAGDLVKKLLEKVPWVEPISNFGFQVPGVSVQKTGWRSHY